MFRLIKIIFNAFLLVLAFIGFNAIGGQKYIESAKVFITNFIEEHYPESARKIGDFSKLNEEFQIDNSVNLIGYKAIVAEHKASGQKMVIIDSGKKPILSQEDITGSGIETKLNKLSEKYKYQGICVKDIKVIERGRLNVYGQNIPYARFEGKITKLPFSDISGMVASLKTSDNAQKLVLSLSEKNKYSQLIANEFYKGVSENK